MAILLSIRNWSLRKALLIITDTFEKSRFRIVHLMLVLAVAKSIVALLTAFYAHQPEQIPRSVVMLICYVTLLKLLLTYPSRILLLSHIMIIAAILLIWSNTFIYSHRINIITLQFIFMTILGSFYALGNRAGLVYTIFSVLPVIAFLFIDSKSLRLTNLPHELASPGFEIITLLNFVTIALAHFYFFKGFRDSVDEKVTLNKQLEQTAAEATKLAEARSLFLSTMSHELRTPLNSVIGVTELITRQNIPEQKENLGILHNSALDLLSLINNILDINKLEWGKIELEKEPFNLYDHLQNVCAGLKVKAAEKKLQLLLKVDEQLKHITVVSDSTRLSQVLYNLVGNAIKFTEQGQITVKAQVRQTAPALKVYFSVEDTGIGIHPDKQEAVFQSFTQAETHTARKYGGTGLGLSIVQQILALFNSTIQLKSTQGSGSTFSFEISFQTMNAIAEAPLMQEEESKALNQLNILVAEDNEINRTVLQKQLDELKVKAVFVPNGEQALKAWMNDDYDAVLLDLDMPVMNGYETIHKMRSLANTVKSKAHLIAFTASVMENEEIAKSGFNDFLYKPVSMKDLREKLERIAVQTH